MWSSLRVTAVDRADYATACRAGAAAAGAPDRRRRLSAVRRPAGRAAHTTGSRAGPTHLIAGAVFAQSGGRWDAADSESEPGAGGPFSPSRASRRPAGRNRLRVGRPGRGPGSTVSRQTGHVAGRGRHDRARAHGRAATPIVCGPGPITSQWGRLPPDPVPQVPSVWAAGAGSPAGVGY